MTVLPPVTALTSTRLEPDAAYAQSFFSGCAAALSTLLNRSVTIELVPGLLTGEEAGEGDVFAPEYQDALRETVNQMFSSASSSLRVFFGKPVGIATAELRQLENADGWHPHVASIAVGVLTIDGVPRARAALTI